jgi:cysteine desulfurase/selenocysteine lyase
MTIDVARARADTPGCREVAHFNNAGAALQPSVVTDAVVDHLRLEARIGGYEAAAREAHRIEHTYGAIAGLLGCHEHEVALAENATRAWDMVFYAFRFGPGDRILTARAEYESNYLAMLQVAARTGVRVEVIGDDEHGQVDVAELERRIDDDVRLVAVTHVPTSSGLVNPAAEIGRVTRAAGVPYLLDACQSVGQMPVDVGAIGCDALAATGRKFLRAPRGTGLLYVAERLAAELEPPMLDLHAAHLTGPDSFEIRRDTRRFESWECDVAARIGLGVAVDYAVGWGLGAIGSRITALAAALRLRLAEVPGVIVRDRGAQLGAIVTFTVDGLAAGDVVARLRQAGVNTGVSLGELVRASVHYYNTDEEIDRLVGEVAALSAGCAT